MDGNTRSGRLVASIWKSFTRSIHYKPLAPNKYPKVNVNDVDLNPPRYGFRRIRPPIIAQSPTKTLFPSVEIAKKYIEEGKEYLIDLWINLVLIMLVKNFKNFKRN